MSDEKISAQGRKTFFHRLTERGDKVASTLEVEGWTGEAELDGWMKAGDISCTIERIALSADRLDIFLRPISASQLQ